MIDWSAMQTAEQKDAEARRREYDEALAARQRAYRDESDPLRLEAEFDALQAGTEPDFTTWVAAVAEIKERIPLPPEPA